MVTRVTVFTDIAGRVARATDGNQWVTAAAVAIATSKLDTLRAEIPNNCPKWRESDSETAAHFTHLLTARALTIGIVHINKDTVEWSKFWEDEKALQDKMIAESGLKAGFAKPANILSFLLFGYAHSLAIGHVFKTVPLDGIVDPKGLQLIESDVVCDSDVKGEENTDFFRSLFLGLNSRGSRIAQLGFRQLVGEVPICTEQEEPLLLLADYAAGIMHAPFLEGVKGVRLPLPLKEIGELSANIQSTTKMARANFRFNHSFGDIFGSLVATKRSCADEDSKKRTE